VPFSHREDGNIADQELPIPRSEDLKTEGLEASPDTLEPILKTDPEDSAAGYQFVDWPVELIQRQLQPRWVVGPPAEDVDMNPLEHLGVVSPLLPIASLRSLHVVW
jgi:hypothetical protein